MKKAKATDAARIAAPAWHAHTHPDEVRAAVEARHGDPFAFLGPHEVQGAWLIRVLRPDAEKLVVRGIGKSGDLVAERIDAAGFFVAEIPASSGWHPRDGYTLCFTLHGGGRNSWETRDPYSFGNLITGDELYYFGEGRNWTLHETLGANRREVDGVAGFVFAVWAPNARRVSVVGDFNGWDGRTHPMKKRIEGGVWELFVPGVEYGSHYKFELLGAGGEFIVKSDPFARFSQNQEQTASITFDLGKYGWGDDAWMKKRKTYDPYRSPLSIYEVHLGSWKRVTEDGNRFLSYRELADQLPAYVREMGFTHIELMPVSEFPFDGSWGYQVGGYFAPTSRFGNPDDFRYFIDRCHQEGIGVIVDWVPAHFPKDSHGLARFDGTALFEHSDPRQGEHRDWGTLIYNFGRNEVRNFLICNALFWLEQYHIDGLRVDAVASMLYLDYSREDGDWIPNQHGGRENLDAIEFMKVLNHECYARYPGVMTIAEESTAWPGVSKPTDLGGLGFGFKWNMGWMNDSLSYIEKDPVHRRHHHGEATFSMIYAFDENFMLVLSHDEVVHGKGSLLDKMPGDRWQKFANLRMFLAWMYAHPGKKLLFMGSEFGMWHEWNHAHSLDWHLLQNPEHEGLRQLVSDVNHLHREVPALHQRDHDPSGFSWLEHSAAEESVFSFLRFGEDGSCVAVAVNATPVPRTDYRIGLPAGGYWREVFNSDAACYGGSGMGNGGGLDAGEQAWQGQPFSVSMVLPPLSAVYLQL
jgi:1,4-alpha-glucan branching enzyme